MHTMRTTSMPNNGLRYTHLKKGICWFRFSHLAALLGQITVKTIFCTKPNAKGNHLLLFFCFWKPYLKQAFLMPQSAARDRHICLLYSVKRKSMRSTMGKKVLRNARFLVWGTCMLSRFCTYYFRGSVLLSRASRDAFSVGCAGNGDSRGKHHRMGNIGIMEVLILRGVFFQS